MLHAAPLDIPVAMPPVLLIYSSRTADPLPNSAAHAYIQQRGDPRYSLPFSRRPTHIRLSPGETSPSTYLHQQVPGR